MDDAEDDRAKAPPDPDTGNGLPPLLERRLTAGAYDTGLISACCISLFLALDPVSQQRHVGIAIPFAVVLALLLLVEALTGRTIGKWSQDLRLRRVDGGAVSLPALLTRTAVKAFPVAIFVLGLGVRNMAASMSLLGVSLMLVLCYIPVCYLMLMRAGHTMFDAASGTVLQAAPAR